MRAMDVMTKEVLTVDANTTVRSVAALLSERGISGVPVVDAANRVVGIVSEGDLLHRAEIGTERRGKRRRSWWLHSLASDLAPDYVKSHGRKIGDVMTREVISVSETTELADVATLLETHGIKRVPVVNNGTLVGIISRANLVRALAAIESEAPASGGDEQTIRNRVQDEMIRKRLLDELSKMEWAKTIWAADVIVKDQKVHLWFTDDRPAEQRRAVHIAAENTTGVRSVEEHIVPGTPVLPVAS
jgi:CBS-domain-containing membrane protein